MTLYISLLVGSGIFPNSSSASFASATYHNLRQPESESLIHVETGKIYNIENFPEYLIKRCKVDPENVKDAIRLLEINNMTALVKEIKSIKSERVRKKPIKPS